MESATQENILMAYKAFLIFKHIFSSLTCSSIHNLELSGYNYGFFTKIQSDE